MSDNDVSPTLLVLDDEAELGQVIGDIALSVGFRVSVTTNAEQFNEELGREVPDLIVVDLQMPNVDGVEILRDLSANGVTSSVMIVSGMDMRTIASAERFGRQAGLNMLDSLQKPFSPEELLHKLNAAQSETRRLTAQDLTAAIREGELQLYYQPIVHRISPGRWHAESAEALLRWNHPTYGLLAPAQFLGLIRSDRGELMRELTDFVFEHGIQQLQAWQQSGFHIGLRVNVAAGLISDDKFPDRLEALLAQYETDPELLTLEIHDPGALTDSSKGHELMTRLRLKNMRLALDDFGAPGSQLNMLYKLPFNEIKIERSLVAEADQPGGSAQLISGLVALAHGMDMTCCAVGVESSKQLQALDDANCDSAQGYLVAPPVAASELQRVLGDWSKGEAAGA